MPSSSINLSELDGSNGFVIQNSNNESFDLSFSVSRIEDINGDGFTDLIVQPITSLYYGYSNSSYYADGTLPSYVVFGNTDIGVSGSIDLSTLDGTNGFRLNGLSQTFDKVREVTTTSDINGDGIAELIIGAPGADPNSITNAGSTYVVFGGTTVGTGGSVEASSLDGSSGFVINGINSGDVLGSSVISGSDINGDGIADLIIGAPGVDPNGITNAGSTYVVFGGTNVGTGGSVEASSFDGSNGFVINGINPGDTLGESVNSGSDINGDGIVDLIIGAPGVDPNGITNAGSTYVVFGGTNVGAGGSLALSALDGNNGFVINGSNQSDYLSESVISGSDINGDGIADLIIAAPYADLNGITNAGSTYVVFGGTTVGAGGSVEVSSFDSSNGFVINGINSGDVLGRSVISGSDINGDGIVDLIISVPGADPNGIYDAGCIYVVFGGTTVGVGGSVELSSLDGNNGFVINGINPGDTLGETFTSGSSGETVISGSDINGDGIADLIISVPRANPNGVWYAGSTYVVFGGTTVGIGGSVELSSFDGSNGFVINGIDPADLLGESVISGSDINSDGIADLIIGARGANPNGITNAGSTYVVFGGTNVGAGGSLDLSALDGNNGFVLNGIARYNSSGASVSGVGDVNGDGIDDVVIGAESLNSSYVVFGSAVSLSDPTAVNDTGMTSINTPLTLNVIANDTDPNGNPLQISSFDTISTQGGSITLNDNGTVDDLSDDLLVYTPPSDLIGFDSFSYTIDNGIGGTATATVNLAVFSQQGGRGSDTLTGSSGGDFIRGGAGDDFVDGTEGDDKLLGNWGNDSLIGGEGNDRLVGGKGSDTLLGGDGDDILNGFGYLQAIDILSGGSGADTFILGNHRVYYTGSGYATITDFDSSQDDKIQVLGDSSQYQLGQLENADGTLTMDTGIFYVGNGGNNLIGVVQGSVDVSWDRDFVFV